MQVTGQLVGDHLSHCVFGQPPQYANRNPARIYRAALHREQHLGVLVAIARQNACDFETAIFAGDVCRNPGDCLDRRVHVWNAARCVPEP